MVVRKDTEIDQWIKEHHYLRSVPAGSRLRLEFLDSQGRRIGAMLWGRPVARNLNQRVILQLTRMYFINETVSFVESKALGRARKHIRKHFPAVKGLITYASTEEGHKGIVYLADGWFEMGRTKSAGKGWESRENRIHRDKGEKIRFVRTP